VSEQSLKTGEFKVESTQMSEMIYTNFIFTDLPIRKIGALMWDTAYDVGLSKLHHD